MTRLWIVLFALTGCGQLFNLETVTLEPDAAIDAAPACTMPSASDTFEDMSVGTCGTWGRVNPTSGVSMAWPVRSNGALVVAPTTGVTASAGCQVLQILPFGPDGVWVELSTVPTSTGYAVIQIDTRSTLAGTSNALTKVAGSLGGVGMFEHPTNVRYGVNVPWLPAQTRYWRLRPANDAHTIVGEVSGDFVNWIEIGHRDLPAPETASYVFVSFGAGRNDTTSDVGKAMFESFDICP